ncbi:MAG: hypothetical protein RLZZ347_451 [Candidatus Parcubacteria bacterium]
MNPLASYKENRTSQWGEDGIIREIFKRIGRNSGVCVEFGAWDGQHMSNTYTLWRHEKWSAVLIEGDKKRFEELKEATKEYPAVVPYNAFVTDTGQDSLDAILKKLNRTEIDLLSIDIDGDDYYIFKTLVSKPRVVIIEYNPTIPAHLSIIAGRGEYFGSSAKAMVELGEKKGYTLAAITETNCIFVRNSEFEKLHVPHLVLEDVFPTRHITYLLSAYDGTAFATQTPPYSKVKRRHTQRQITFTSQTSLVPISLHIRTNIKDRLLHMLYTLKNVGKKIPGLMYLYKKIRVVSAVLIWQCSGKPVPAPHKIKEQIVKKYRKLVDGQTLVETGTYMGEMIDATCANFKKIISIELDTTLAHKAQKRFAHNKNITILQGDSSALLPSIIQNLSGTVVFWLDAHYSGGITAKGDHYTPILSEVKIIASYPQKNTTLLIDDARLFTGKDEYPLLSDFKEYVTKLFPKHTYEVIDDVIRLSPQN